MEEYYDFIPDKLYKCVFVVLCSQMLAFMESFGPCW